MPRAPLVALLSAIVLAIAAVAAGCGGGEDTVGFEPIAKATEATERAGGAHMTMEGETTVQGQTVPVRAEGVMDAKGNSELEMELPGGAGTAKQVFADWVMYQQMPGVEEQFGKEWTRTDMREAYRHLGIDFDLIAPPGGNDPKSWLGQMKSGADEIEKVGTEEVRGVETTHYRADVELRKAVDRAPAARRAEAERAVEKIIDISGSEGFPIEVWIDENDLVRRMRMEMSLNNPVFGGKLDMDVSMELFDYGTPVSIDVPSDDEAEDLTEVVAQQLR